MLSSVRNQRQTEAPPSDRESDNESIGEDIEVMLFQPYNHVLIVYIEQDEEEEKQSKKPQARSGPKGAFSLRK